MHALLAEHGMGFSMDAVAQRAGCSKQTLYSRYGSKQGLLRRVVVDKLDLKATPLADIDLRSALVTFAIEHSRHLAEPSTIAARRLLPISAAEFATETAELFQSMVGGLQARLAQRLDLAMCAGQLRAADPAACAELLFAMMNGLDPERPLYGLSHRDNDTSRREWAEFAVDTFLRAFAPHPV